ncbi:MAG: prohibitin family protein, partial [Verrucomicrobia bacterium]|nr:prohibitin family protein [Verrucomicrobiota bacterium]
MQTKILAAVVAAVVLLFLLHFLVGFQTVGGNQLGVKETWWGGVDPQPLQPRTYMFVPGFTTKVYPYEKSTQVFIMNNIPSSVEKVGRGRETDAYKVQSEEGQDMTISLSVQWRIDPEKVVEIHKTVRHDIEEKILRPTVMRVVKDAATTRKAIDAYSGNGLVKLQKEIQDRLTDPASDLRRRGVIVENFVIEGITLDPDYIGQIKARQVATQKQLTAAEEQKAAEAVALRSKAEAQADYNKRLVEAERDKAVGVLKAEQEARQQVLAAEAQKEQQVLAA